MKVSLTAKRERKHRRSMERTPPVAISKINSATRGQINVHSYYERAELAHACAVKAVQTGFSYLPIARIIKPPRADKVAQLARQIAIYIMVQGLDIEQRQISRMQGRQRTSIHFALQAVERRLECPVFCTAYERMAMQAHTQFEATMGAA